MLIDTHCHIHEATYPLDIGETLVRARQAGVEKLICVGTDQQSSQEALGFATQHDNAFAAIGVHPHEAKDGWAAIEVLVRRAKQKEAKLVAIGEIGLDYFYTHSPRKVQIRALETQLQLALDNNLPIIFHIRDAFDDFWPIFDNFHGIRGEMHSFTDTQLNLDEGLKRGLYVGVNGISTFTKDIQQQQLFANIPLDKLLLETDAPFLTPTPFRGKMNEPAYVRNVAEFHAKVRNMSLEQVAVATSHNAAALFALL